MRVFSPFGFGSHRTLASVGPLVLSLIALLALGVLTAGCPSDPGGINSPGEGEGEGEGGEGEGEGVGEGEGEGAEGEGEEGEGEGDEGEGEEGEGEGEEGEGEGVVVAPDVRLNEIDCRGQDHIEIVGPAGTDLTGIVLAEGLGEYTLPPGSIIDDSGIFLVNEEQQATPDDGTGTGTGTGTAGAGEAGFSFEVECFDRTLTLSFEGAVVDSVTMPAFPGAFEGTTFCRLPDATGDWSLCTSSLSSPNTPYIDPDDVLFNPLQVVTVEISLSDAALSSLAMSPRTYVEGQVAVIGADGTTYGPTSAGVAIKGNEAGSFRPLSQKAAFKVKFNEFVAGNRLLGLKGFKLNNMVEDPSYLHEAVGYMFYRQLGVPAARAGYARVLVNGSDYGLHALIERIDSIFASRHFADTQHIYEGGILGVDAVPCTPECSASTTCVCVEDLEVDVGDETNRADVDALAAASVGTGDAFFSNAQAVVDFQASARTWIAGQYLYHWDGYAGGRNNFYLHSDDDGVFTWIPSGMDQSMDPTAVGLDESYPLKTGQTPFAGGTGAQGTFFFKCRNTPACDAVLDGAIDEVDAAVAAWDMVAFLDDVRAVIEADVQADPRRPTSLTLDEVHAAQDATRSLLEARVSVLP